MRGTWVWSLGLEDPLEKEMQPTPVFLPGISLEQRSLVGYSPWGHKESDTAEHTQHNIFHMWCLSYLEIRNLIFFFFATLQGLWDLSSPTRDRTWTLALKAAHLNHWTTRESLEISNLNFEVRVLRCHILNLFFPYIFSVFHWLVIIFL